MKAGVIVFPGSNCDRDMEYTFREALGMETVLLWHKDQNLQGCDVIGLPGGFSYGDYLRGGAIARFSPIMKEVVRFAQKGGKVIGICNGFQILTESHLLEGALLQNQDQRFICKNVCITPTGAEKYQPGLERERAYKIPLANAEGRFVANQDTLKQLEDEGRILFKYADAQGDSSAVEAPNGSMQNIAGICNAAGNVIGIMPHPERAADPHLGNEDGLPILESMLNLVHS